MTNIVSEQVLLRARGRLQDLTKPLGSLGQLEPLVERIAKMTGHVAPRLERPALVLFAADHGVTAEGVSAYSETVTEEMVVNICMGGAVSSVLARNQKIPIIVVDVGIRGNVRHPAALVRKIGPGTHNLAVEAAMTRRQAEQAVQIGKEVANSLFDAGHDVLLVGEMGIGNTTASSAMTAQLLSRDVLDVLGRGTGVNDTTLERKALVLQRAMTLHQSGIHDVWDVLARMGGFEIAAIAGAILAAAKRHIPVVLDGFITCAAALWAKKVDSEIGDYMVASHVSTEPGHQLILNELGLTPLLDIGMRVGEGSGALMTFPLIQLACQVLAQTATFTDARVSNPHTSAREWAINEIVASPEGKIERPTKADFSSDEQEAVYKVIMARRDIRSFLPDPISDDILQRILVAGHHGPSVGYMQPWNFIVIRKKQVLQALQHLIENERLLAASNYTGIQQAHYLRLKIEGVLQAPITICVTNDSSKGGPHVLGRNTIPETDLMSTSCAIENMWLAARAEGVGLGWVSFYQKKDVRKILGIPESVDPVALLTLGYTPHFPEIPGLERAGWGQRLPLTDIVFEDTWGKQMGGDR